MMSVIERWTIYEGIEGTHGIWTERGDHPGWKGTSCAASSGAWSSCPKTNSRGP
jgi:hypothetical protein